ncbi:MAG: hypothetical protein KDA86_22500 [Planctomycetaceae bacterium]|nr:hypothetical protein [Planctomycetaceae bacterium]
MHSIRIQLLRLAPPNLLAMMTFPLIVTGLLLIFVSIRTLHRAYQVHRYIVQNQALVEDRLRNPKVHMFSLSRDLDELRVTIDVEDMDTFELLEHDLADLGYTLEIQQVGDVNVRSGEKLGNDWGAAAAGIGLSMSGMRLVVVGLPLLALTSFTIMGLLYLWLRRGGLQVAIDDR